MKITQKIKDQADGFALSWCYDWQEGSERLDATIAVDSKSSNEVLISSTIWSINTKKAEVVRTDCVYQLTLQQLNLNQDPMEATDQPDGDFIDGDQISFHLLSEDYQDLEQVPKEILIEATETLCQRNVEVVTDLCFTGSDDTYAFHIPSFHPKVRRILRKYCCEEAIDLRRRHRESRRNDRQYELVINAKKQIQIKAGRKAPGVVGFMGSGIGIFNGMVKDGAPSSMGSAIRFAEWLKVKQTEGCSIYPVSGIFKGKQAEGPLVVAVCNISKDEVAKSAARTGAKAGLFIGSTRYIQIIEAT